MGVMKEAVSKLTITQENDSIKIQKSVELCDNLRSKLMTITGDAGNINQFIMQVKEEKERVREKLEFLSTRQQRIVNQLADF